ncbi:hypothetical protein DFQ14_104245 [Halopolyspora algeriensis]|uniref:Uncharacterized protein n=1 Tax=Halopolyspora algeriensis TaxID=1500506 RepID=A0A368VTY5_9ACTN|nr:hypothetical protein [Halopolyspora algeriensis]RCW44656.1 hypothetical protein DFQ14_104245 [Halopolyspora algeriensis]TQM56017.1 hypothetical protein FHU43_0795 [Halopolyspora algeriensis]
MVIGFGLLMVMSLAISALSEAEAFPEGTMTFSGLMAMGFAELLDPKLHRFVVTMRFVGAGTALFGAALRLL